MLEKNVMIAEAYCKALGDKDINRMEQYLHPDVRFIGPMAETTGKEALLGAAKAISSLFKTLTIRAKFGQGDQAMLVYDLEFPMPIGISRGANLMTFKEGLISCIELFYDARPCEKKKDEIFSQKE